ncbi:hypothetical protein ACI77O_13220 [Pseudomonas tritici]|uniref:hypothetical protein n=1 Tax=Pseudomonas tritici TaxID=2745518 RepID=UPI00387AC543
MKKVSLFALALATAFSSCAFAEGADDELLSRNRTLDQMKFNRDKLTVQAQMAKNWKEMIDAQVIVDAEGNPMGIGDVERLALEVRRRGATPIAQSFNPSDPFGGNAPVVPMGSQGLFGESAFGPPTAPPAAAAAPEVKAEKVEKVEVVEKPTEREKADGKQILRLVELRSNSALFFTNEGFQEIKVGQSIYNQKLASVGIDSATLNGKDSNRVLRIDWTKSVRYSDD